MKKDKRIDENDLERQYQSELRKLKLNRICNETNT